MSKGIATIVAAINLDAATPRPLVACAPPPWIQTAHPNPPPLIPADAIHKIFTSNIVSPPASPSTNNLHIASHATCPPPKPNRQRQNEKRRECILPMIQRLMKRQRVEQNRRHQPDDPPVARFAEHPAHQNHRPRQAK